MADNRIGSHIADDPRGWLRFTYLSAELQRAEDRRLAADRERAGRPGDYGSVRTFTRPATDTERTLLDTRLHADRRTDHHRHVDQRRRPQTALAPT